MTANSLLAAAMAGGEDGLSPRDCWLCIAYIYASGKTAQAQLNQAIADGLDKLPTGDVLKCIAYLLNNGSASQNLIPAGAVYGNGTPTYTVTPLLTPGDTYSITFGSNDIELFNGAQTITTNGTFVAAASGNSIILLGTANGVPVTATILFVSAPTSTLLNGLVAYWKLNETSGNASDSVGGFTLTNNNGVTYVPGIIGNGANFVSASSQRLITTAQIITGTITTLSLVGWINRSSAGNIVTFGFSDDARSNLFNATWYSDGNIYFQLGNVSLSDKVCHCALSGTGWHHVAIVYDGSQPTDAEKLLVYIDDVQQVLIFDTPGFPASYTVPAQYSIGWDSNPTFGYSDGIIDEVGIWNRVLTPTEVATDYNSGTGITYPFS